MADDVHVRLCLQDIVKLDLEAKAIIHDIRQDAKTLEMLDDFNALGRRKIAELRAKISDLKRLGLEQERDSDKDAILVNVESLRQKLSSTVTNLRQTCLKAKIELDNKVRDQLLTGSLSSEKKGQGNKESLVKSANDISESLFSLNRLMADQVKQSELNMSSLEKGSTVLVGFLHAQGSNRKACRNEMSQESSVRGSNPTPPRIVPIIMSCNPCNKNYAKGMCCALPFCDDYGFRDLFNRKNSVTRLQRAEMHNVQESGMQEIASSSHEVTGTHQEFHNMGNHIQHSQRLLTKYGRREFTDRLLILLALVFFFATVLYIMKKRLWPS